MNRKLNIHNIQRLRNQWITKKTKIERVDEADTIYWLHTNHPQLQLLALYRYPVDLSDGMLWELKSHGTPFPNRILLSKNQIQTHYGFLLNIEKLFQ